jgi:hypothetical protein
MSLLQSLLFPKVMTVESVVARKVTVATPDDIGEETPVPKKRIRKPRGGGKRLATSGERNICFNEIRQSFYVLITHNGQRRGKYGFRTVAEAVIARNKLEAEMKGIKI